MSSKTERATAEKRDNQMDSDDENRRNRKKTTNRSKENVKKKTNHQSVIQISSSDSESDFTDRPSSRNSRITTKVSNKHRESKYVVSDDESPSETQKKWRLEFKGTKPRTSGPKSSKNIEEKSLIIPRRNTKTTYYTLASSDSTGSEKEFSKHKMLDSYVYLRRISEVSKDYTEDAVEDKEDKRLTKNQSFLLKNNLQKLFQDLKILSNKLMNDIEHTRKTYYYKENLQASDATKAMIECKNIIRNLKEKTNDCEKLLVDRYNTWCQKTKNKNIFINQDEPNTPKRWESPIDKKTVIAPSSSSDDESKENSKTKKKTTVESNSGVNGQKALSEVSDFDGKEIFSADEEANNANLHNTAISTNVQNNEEKNMGKRAKSNNKENEIQKDQNDADSSDSDRIIMEKNDLANINEENQVEKNVSDQEENQEDKRNSSPNVLNESGDLFLDSDEGEGENQLISDNENQTLNKKSNSKDLAKSNESLLNKDNEENQNDAGGSSSETEKVDSNRKESTRLDDETESVEKEKSLHSSSDSESNNAEDVSKTIKKSSKLSNSKHDKLLEDEVAKKKLLDSSSDSEGNDADDDGKSKEKLSEISSDSESKVDIGKTKKKLSNSKHNKLLEDEIAKKKLLDSSSDSEANGTEDGIKTKRRLSQLSNSERKKLEKDKKAKEILDSSSDTEPDDVEDDGKTRRKSSELQKSGKNKLEEDEGAKKTLLDSSSDSEANDVGNDAKPKKRLSEPSNTERRKLEKDKKTKETVDSSSDSESNDVEDDGKSKRKSSESDSEKNKLDVDEEAKKTLLDSSSDSETNKLDVDEEAKKTLLDSSSDSETNDTENISTVKKKVLKSSERNISEDENVKKTLLDSSSDSEPNDAEDDETIKEKLLELSSDTEKNEEENLEGESNKNVDKNSTTLSSDLVENNSEINDKENDGENVSNSSSNSTKKVSEKSSKKNVDEDLSDSTSDVDAEIPENGDKINNQLNSDSDHNDFDEQKAKTDLLESSSDSDQDERNVNNSSKETNVEEDENINNLSKNDDNQTEEKRTLRNRKKETKKNDSKKNASDNSPEKVEPKKPRKKKSFSDYEDREINSDIDIEKRKKKVSSNSSSDSDSNNSNDKKMKKKFLIKHNQYYKNDKKLRMKCSVQVRPLSKKVLAQHSKALQLSKDYLEAKQIHSLLTLDNLERTKTHQPASSDGEESSSKKTKKKQKNEPEETLLDHLNKVNSENNDQDSDSNNSENEFRSKSVKNSKLGSVIEQADQLSKARLLESSGSEVENNADENNASDTNNDKNKKKAKQTEASKKKNSDEDNEGSDDSNEKNSEDADKKDWKKSKILTSKFLETDSEEENEKTQQKLKKRSMKKTDSDSENDTPDKNKNKKKRNKRRRILGSDDSDVKLSDLTDSDSEVEKKDNDKNKKGDDKKTSKRRKKSDSDSDSVKEKAPRSKRRRIRQVANDSDSSDNEHQSSQTSGTKGSGRKNIRKVMKDKQVAQDTQEAAKQEEERLRRMAERQKLYNEMYETRLANEEKVDKLVLDFDEESKEILLSVDEKLVRRLKPHQAKGIKFMWDACFESLERVQSTPGSGCILAHCMGLGKSFQVVTLAHTLLTHSEKTDIKTVLVVAPLSTVLNWMNEFKMWLSEVENGDDIELYELTKAKTTMERKCHLENWQRTGGVLIMGYEMFRNLCAIKGKVKKSTQEAILKCILEPGPDLIICDEGHLLKNEDTAISKAIRKVRTLRRVVLTGTPLQNNLIEYHCMVQFVKPNLLGTKKEFSNRFVNPIQNGQFDDSTEYDVKIMKRRAHVLHKMLEGSVQRFDYSVLTPFLPPKQEYVISVKLTEVQCKMYQYYLDHLSRRQTRVGGSLFADFQGLYRIWTHPYVMKLHAENHEKIMMKKREAASDSEGSLKDFIDDDSDTSSSSSESDHSNGSDVVAVDNQPKKSIKRSTRANPVEEEVVVVPDEEPAEQREWWAEYVKPEHYDDVRVSAKLLILLDILKEAEQIGDKVLVFSQSLYSLSLIEKFLGMIDDETQNGNELETLDKHSGSWSLGLDYFRFDGQTSAENRTSWVKSFNKPSNTRARLFLISTRAGGLGINLTAANRVVIFDASWNPSHDVQSIFRIYRFGQKKPCYVYRLLAAGTMEEKIYNRQVTKLSLSCRVVDEQQIERHYSNHDLAELYRLEPPKQEQPVLALPKDRLLAEIFLRHKDVVENYHEHDSLLENIAEEELNDEERKQAWQEYEEEKAGRRQMPMMGLQYNPQLMLFNNQMMDPMNLNNPMQQGEHGKLLEMIKKDYPNLSEAAQREMAYKALNNMYSYVESQFAMQTAKLPTMNIPHIPNMNMGNPSSTFANMLAQNEYTRAHNQYSKTQLQQFQYAQKYGNTLLNLPSQTVRPATSAAAYTANDDEIIEIPPSNKGNSEKSQEE